ncbi:hypothetical protein RJZ90_005486 [Blastomyces dermatitidis]
MSRQDNIPMTQLNQTALTGVWVYGFTFFQILDNGKQSSRAYAYVTREAAIMHAWPIEKQQIIVRARMATASLWGMTWNKYDAHGWSRSDSSTAATTSWRNHPISPPKLEVITMARGHATFAFEHSSLKWNGESYPDIAQITLTKDIRTERPFGYEVPSYIFPQTSEGEENLGELVVPMGMAMRTITRAMMLKTDPYEFKWAIHFVGMLLRTA